LRSLALERKVENLAEKEQLVQSYLDQGDKEAAIKLLFELAVACAKEKNFEAAEAMRSRIFEIDAMALSEIVRSGEIIENEKSQAIDPGHREIFAKLYDDLSVEEANALYFALKKGTYEAGETIFQEGERKQRLYFINSGRAKIVCFQDGSEVFLKTVEPGQLAGEDSFFSLTLCEVTLIALSRTEVMYLDSDILKAWRAGCPTLESKLQSFASSREKTADLLLARGIDRRRMKRVKIAGKATALLMSSSEDPVGKPFIVDLCDISRGGVSFFVRITKRETAGLLFGKRICISYLHPQMDPSNTIKQNGTMVSVQFDPFEGCTVSVKFDALLPEGLIEQFEKLPPPLEEFDF
jgi:CRP-like cAMP-binding protein